MFGQKNKQAVLASYEAKLLSADGQASEGVSVGPHAKGLKLSGGDLAMSSASRPGGYSIQVPDAFEKAASGNRVRVTAIVAAIGRSGKFALAYSTNEVGNSGWREFTANSKPQAFSFEYDVEPMIGGHGDFLGLLPIDPVVLSGLRVEAIRR